MDQNRKGYLPSVPAPQSVMSQVMWLGGRGEGANTSSRPADWPATPLFSQAGCRLFGTPAWLPVRGGGGVTSALLRPGAGGLLALAGGVDTRYSRGGGSNSMTSPGMKAPPHTLARLETHAGSPPVTSLFFTVSRFTPQVSSKPPCLPQNCRSNALFICSRLTWTVSAPRRGSLMSPITSPRRRVAPVSTCLLSIR